MTAVGQDDEVAGMELIPLGVGDAFSARHYSTSLAVRDTASGAWLLVDCPHPIHKILREATASSGVELPLTKLAGTLISHLHSDHCSGLEGLGYYIRYRIHSHLEELREDELPVLVAGPRVATALAGEEAERQVFQIRGLEPGKVLELGPFQVETRPTVHGSMPCYAFRISSAGRSVGHSADTRLDPELIEWLAAADFMVHEIGSPIPGTGNHTCHGELAEFLKAWPEVAAKVHLAHYGDEFCRESTELKVLAQGVRYLV